MHLCIHLHLNGDDLCPACLFTSWRQERWKCDQGWGLRQVSPRALIQGDLTRTPCSEESARIELDGSLALIVAGLAINAPHPIQLQLREPRLAKVEE